MGLKKTAAFLAIGMAALLFGAAPKSYAEGEDPELHVAKGVFIGNVDLGGMTREEARSAVDAYFDGLCAQKISFALDGESREVLLKDLGLEWTNEEMLDEALARGKGRSLISEYKAMRDIEIDGAVYDLDLRVSEPDVRAYMEQEFVPMEQEAADAQLTRENGEFVLTPSQNGRAVDIAGTQNAIAEALKGWTGDPIKLDVCATVTEPAHSTEELSQIKDVLGSATTQYSTGNGNRSYNIYNGTNMINGTVLYPGESFSAYEHIAPITSDNGYRVATAYENGQEVDSVGGGVCQISTTLYNAVLKAELEVTERYNHSMSVTYVDLAKDSTIAGTAKDLKFTNNSDTPVYIEGNAGGGYVTFTIYGKETRPSNRRLEFVSKTISTIYPGETIYTDDPTMDEGTESRIQGSHTGYVAELWKYVYIDDELSESILLHTDRYNASPARYLRGTKKVEESSTEESSTEDPASTEAPTTEAPTTEAPTTAAPTTEAPTTAAPPESSDSDN